MRAHAIVVLLLSLPACGGRIEDQADDGLADEALINGALDAAHPEVGQVFKFTPPNIAALCTGTLVGTHTVLTAGHCVADGAVPAPPARMHFKLGETSYAVRRVALKLGYDVTRVPTNDVAVLELVNDVPDVRPMRVSSTPPVPGERVVLIGFGRTTNAQAGDQKKRVGTNQVAQIEPTWFSMTGASGAGSGVCHGDSGGPTLAARGGTMRVAGIHSTATCDSYVNVNGVDRDFSRDVRADAYLPFITAQAQGNLYAGGPYEQQPPSVSATLRTAGGTGEHGEATATQLGVAAHDDLEVDRVVVFVNGERVLARHVGAAGYEGDLTLPAVPTPRADGTVWIQVAAVDRGGRRTNVDLVY